MRKLSIFLVFTLSVTIIFAQQTGTFTDNRDGKVYKTVKIGNQWWMAENLAYKANSGYGAYDNYISNVSKYGYLYTWRTAKRGCPDGWHLPSDAEWKELTDYLGGEKVAGRKLKSSSGWELHYGKNYGNNKSGFSALPGGYYLNDDGSFLGLNFSGNWWSASEGFLNKASIRNISSYDSSVENGYLDKSNGLSVRCIRD